MQEIKITQYNKLLVNYDTYEFTPSNYSQIVVDNPWFIDTSLAPDFMQSVQEINNLNNLTINEDTYSYEENSFKMYLTKSIGDVNDLSVTRKEGKHIDIINGICNEIDFIMNHETSYYANIHYNYIEYYTSNATNMTQSEQILFPILNVYGFMNNQTIPLIKTITITFDSSQFHMYIPEDTLSITWKNTSTLTMPASDYKYIDYVSTIFDHLQSTRNKFKYIDEYPYMTIDRFQNPECLISGGEFNKLYGIFHCYKNNNALHNSIMPANSRCLHVPSGDYTVDDFINKVNSNSSDVLFTLSSTNKYIYVNCDMPFIINPVCSIVNENTDISETFNTKHVLMVHPMNKYFTATCTYKSQTYSQEDHYTPAGFLKWIYSVTGVKCRIHNNIIQCLDYDLIVGDNPYFVFKEFGIVENLCGMHTIDYKVVLDNSCDLLSINYEPILTSYDYSFVNITDNIVTVMNTSPVELFKV